MTIRIPKGVFLLDTFSEQKGREFVASGVVFPNVLFFCRVEHSISLLFTLFLFAMPRLEIAGRNQGHGVQVWTWTDLPREEVWRWKGNERGRAAVLL